MQRAKREKKGCEANSQSNKKSGRNIVGVIDRTRGNGLKFYQCLDWTFKNNFFPQRIVRLWNRLPWPTMEVPFMKGFKSYVG